MYVTVGVNSGVGKSGNGDGAQAVASQSSIEAAIAEKIGTIQQLHSNANAAQAVAKVNEIIGKLALARLVTGTSLSSQSSESST